METTSATISMEQLMRRVFGEYLEMPGLRLTLAQAQRLWALDELTCIEILDLLTEVRFLNRQNDGTYTRLVDGPVVFPAPRMARAERPAASKQARLG